LVPRHNRRRPAPKKNQSADKVGDKRRLVIVASRWDESARALADRWSGEGACVLTAKDLSTAGWRYRVPHRCETALAVVGGNSVPVADISGVLIRIAGITEHELGFIAPADRAYVAAEMTAFLLVWLANLPCAVVNRSHAGCLSGPAWRAEQWIHKASRLGIPVAAVHRATSRFLPAPAKAPEGTAVTVTVVGQRCLGSTNSLLVAQARALAKAAGVDLLDVCFNVSSSGTCFIGASTWPDITRGDVADALLETFRAPSRNGGHR
jgi:hypothetical protein